MTPPKPLPAGLVTGKTAKHPEATCENCGEDNPVWHAPSEVWNAAVGSPNGILCPRCFIALADKQGIGTGIWTVAPSRQESPHHYSANGMEAIDVIEAFDLGFRLGNVVKYVLRYGRKSTPDDVTDLRKALWYLERELKQREANGNG